MNVRSDAATSLPMPGSVPPTASQLPKAPAYPAASVNVAIEDATMYEPDPPSGAKSESCIEHVGRHGESACGDGRECRRCKQLTHAACDLEHSQSYYPSRRWAPDA